jgi:hypothetical protein
MEPRAARERRDFGQANQPAALTSTRTSGVATATLP